MYRKWVPMGMYCERHSDVSRSIHLLELGLQALLLSLEDTPHRDHIEELLKILHNNQAYVIHQSYHLQC